VAWASARTTIRRARLTTAPTLLASRPPIANHGTDTCAAACPIGSMPIAGRPSLVGVACTGRPRCSPRVRRIPPGPDQWAEPDEGVAADELARGRRTSSGRRTPSGLAAARSGRSPSRKSAGGLAERARGRGGGQQLVVGRVLVAQLEEVDAPGQRALERALHPAAVGDEVQAGIAQAVSAVHAHSLASPRASIRGQREPVSSGLRGRHHGRRPSGADPGHAGEARGHDISTDSDSDSYDVAVVGGGLVGLAVAWRARVRGLSVLVLDRGEPGAGTSRVAAGMLAPVAETDAGERAARARPAQCAGLADFAAQLPEVSGIDVGYRPCGTLMLARSRRGGGARARATCASASV
jgi:hypothetical protein